MIGSGDRARRTAILAVPSVLLVGDFTEARYDLLPAFAHFPESRIVYRQDEAGMDKAKARPLPGFCQGPGDDRVQPRAVSDVLRVATLPGIGEALVRRHLEHLAVDDPVPAAGRRGLIGEAIARHGLEAGR